MPAPLKIHHGQKFGTLTVCHKQSYKLNGYLVWSCVCSCGKVIYVRSNQLGKQKSCGCRQMGQLKHGESNTRLYNIWHSLKQRCLNEFCGAWRPYNSLQTDWRQFLNFRQWALESGYADQKQIKRKIIARGFNAENCVWIDQSSFS
jgi:hypothetical protein